MKDSFAIKLIIYLCFVINIGFLLSPILALFLSGWFKSFDVFKDPLIISAFLTSIKSTFISLIVIIVFGIPTAYIMARNNFKFKWFLEIIIELPLVLPPAVAGLLLLLTFGKNGFIGKLLYALNIQLAFSFWAVVIAQIFVASSIFIKTLRTGIEKVDRDLEITAAILGDNPIQVLRKITLPLIKNSIITACIFAWTRSLAEFGATIMFAGNLLGKTQTLPLAIYTAMEQDINISLAIAVLLIVISVFALLILRKVLNRC